MQSRLFKLFWLRVHLNEWHVQRNCLWIPARRKGTGPTIYRLCLKIHESKLDNIAKRRGGAEVKSMWKVETRQQNFIRMSCGWQPAPFIAQMLITASWTDGCLRKTNKPETWELKWRDTNSLTLPILLENKSVIIVCCHIFSIMFALQSTFWEAKRSSLAWMRMQLCSIESKRDLKLKDSSDDKGVLLVAWGWRW